MLFWEKKISAAKMLNFWMIFALKHLKNHLKQVIFNNWYKKNLKEYIKIKDQQMYH